jgi:threonine aldolase
LFPNVKGASKEKAFKVPAPSTKPLFPMHHKSTTRRSFASDNNAGVHPKVMEAIARANDGHVVAYGDDPFTARAVKKFREQLGKDVEVFFVFGGTGANVLGLSAVTQSHHAIICAATAHINVDECGAPEKFTGCKLLPLITTDGKIRPDQLPPLLHEVGFEHHVQPRVVSISQATEMGTVYTPREIKDLAKFSHDHDMYLHVDGARISNAAASLNVKLRAITRDAGVDVLSFGGAKNGMMYGEAVVFFDKSLAENFKYTRKQGTHLPSKMRFISAQFEAMFTDELWRQNAEHANRMAQLLAGELRSIPGVELTQPVQSNGVFVRIPRKHIPSLQKHYFFYVWNEETAEVRLMTSFDTTEDDIREFIALLKKVVR